MLRTSITLGFSVILAGFGIHADLLHAADTTKSPEVGGLAADKAGPSPIRVRLLERIKDHWSDQIARTSQIQDEQPIDLSGPGGTPIVHGGYAVTSPRNPIIDANCRAESLADAVAVWARAHKVSDDEAFANREAHIRDLQAQFATGVSFSAWIRHIAKCKEFCLIAVRDLLACHVQAVSSLPHGLVFFGFDSDRIDPDGSAAIDDFVARLRKEPERRILLIGRASHLGSAGPAYNRSLSARRTRIVSESLRYRGIPSDSIQALSIGYEEPQLTKTTADMYGVSEHFRRLGASGINQSVIMVLY
jgi:outer membrane protein OmpA-like peptidoglycan-associated protein